VAKRAAEAMLQDLLPILRAFEEGTASPGWAKEIRGLGEILPREIVTELLARTTHLNAILQNLGEGILFLDPSYRILYVNPTGTALLQHPESELVGTPLTTILEAGDEDPFLDTLRALRTHQGPASEQLVYAYRDRTFHLTITNLHEEQWAAGQLVIIRDVTRLFRRMHELAVLNDLAVLLTSTSDVDDILGMTMERIHDLMNVEASALLLRDDDRTDELVFRIGLGEHGDMVQGRGLKVGEGIAGWVAQHGTPLIVPNVQEDPRFHGEVDIATGFRTKSMLCVPLKTRDRVLGVIQVMNGVTKPSFTQEDLNLLSAIAMQAATAIENARLLREMESANRNLTDMIQKAQHEITERERAQTALQQSEARLRALIEAAPDPIAAVNQNGQIVIVNTAAEKLFGYAREELLGQRVEILLPERVRAAHVAHRTGYLSNPHVRPMGAGLDLRGLRKDGGEVPVEISLSPLATEEGILTISIIRDITERKQAEKIREALYRASLQIQEPLELTDRLERLLDVAQTVLELDRVNILLADGEGRWLEAVATAGTTEPLEALRVPIGDEGGAIAQAYLTKQSIMWHGRGPVPEAMRLKPPYDQIEAFRSRVFANVPLVVRGRAIGVLGADRKRSRRPLEPESLELLQLFAAQAAIAIDSARLYKESEQGRDYLKTLLEITKKIGATIDLDELLQTITDEAARLLGASGSAFRLLEEDDLVLKATSGMARDMGLQPRLKIGESISGHAVRENRIVVTEIGPDSNLVEEHRAALRAHGITQVMVVPVRRGDYAIGVLSIHFRGDRSVAQHDIDLATTFADQAAIAVEKTRLLYESQRRGARLEALTALSRTASATLDPQQVLDFVVRATVDLLEANLARLWLWDEDGQVLRISASAGDPDLVPSLRQTTHPGEGMSGLAFAEKRIVATEAPATDPRFEEHAWAAEKGIQAYAAVPLLVGARAVGVLGVARRTPGAFHDDDIALLRSFAAQAAIAIENARLYYAVNQQKTYLEERVRDRTQELEAANLQLRKALEEAEEASRVKSEFLATMSHELRTPLNPIIGFSELLQDQHFGTLNEKQQQYIDRILTSGRHLLSLINGILDLAKAEAGRLDLEPEPLNLPLALQTAVNGIRPQTEPRELDLHLDVEHCPASLMADPLRLRQILDCLLSNAVKFTPSGGRVTVTARQVQGSEFRVQGKTGSGYEPSTMNYERHWDFVEIAVQDTGIGIKAEDLPRLFQPFTQLDASLARKHEGAGLGLALAKKLVGLHGGTIQVSSPGEGHGSTFTLTLPLHPPAPA
jgi:PAS domain S-box-containing protein